MGNSQSNTNVDVYNYHESVLKEGAKPVVIGSSDEDSDEEAQEFFQREGPSQSNLDESPETADQPEDDVEVNDVSDDEMHGEGNQNSEHDDSVEEEEPSAGSNDSDAEMTDIENNLNSTAESLNCTVDRPFPQESNSPGKNELRNFDLVSSSSEANEGDDEFVTPSSSSRENSLSPMRTKAPVPSSSRENSSSPKKAKTPGTKKHRLSMRDSDDSEDEKEDEGKEFKRTTRSQSRSEESKDEIPATSKSTETNNTLNVKKSSNPSVGQESSGKQNINNIPVDMKMNSSTGKTRGVSSVESQKKSVERNNTIAPETSPEAAIKRLSQIPPNPTNSLPNNAPQGKHHHQSSKVSLKQREETHKISPSSNSKSTNIVHMLKKNSIHLKSIIDSKKNGNRKVDEEKPNSRLNTSKDKNLSSNEHHASLSDEELMEITSNMGESSEITNMNSPMKQSFIKEKGNNLTSFTASESTGINTASNSTYAMVSESSAFKPIERQPANIDESAKLSTSSSAAASATKPPKRPYKEVLESLECKEASKVTTQNAHPNLSSGNISSHDTSGMANNLRKESVFSRSKTFTPKTGVVVSSSQASKSPPSSPNETHTSSLICKTAKIPTSGSKSSTVTSQVSNRTESSPKVSAGSSSSPYVTQRLSASTYSSSPSMQALPAASSAPLSSPSMPMPSPQSGAKSSTRTLTSSGPYHMIFTLMDGYHMSVNLDDITSERTEVIVNSTDSHLNHAGSLSRKIAAVSGPNMANECRQILFDRQKPLEVGDVVHTSAGGQLVNVKHLLHVVPPMGSHSDNNVASVKKLTHSYLQCCRYADLKLNCSSIAFPLLGSGSFSPDVSINSFYNAVLIFLSDRTPLSHLQDIRLIINDYELYNFTVDYLGSCYENILTQGIDRSMADAVDSFYGNRTWETQRSLVGAFFASCRSPAGGSEPSSSTRAGSDQSGTGNSTQNLFRGPAIKRPRL